MLSSHPELSASAVRAHALKNCLAVIAAVNRLLERELSAATQERLLRSKQAVRRMVELIDADLRPANDNVEGRGGEFLPAVNILSAVRMLVEDLAATNEVALDFRIGSGGIRGHFACLVEALGNIVKNAVESSPAGGLVVVESAELVSGGQLWTVRDFGPGIPLEILAHVGKPYVSQRPGGSGLGVAIARNSVESHGGIAQFESDPGGGTLVSIWLPPVPPT